MHKFFRNFVVEIQGNGVRVPNSTRCCEFRKKGVRNSATGLRAGKARGSGTSQKTCFSAASGRLWSGFLTFNFLNNNVQKISSAAGFGPCSLQ